MALTDERIACTMCSEHRALNVNS